MPYLLLRCPTCRSVIDFLHAFANVLQFGIIVCAFAIQFNQGSSKLQTIRFRSLHCWQVPTRVTITLPEDVTIRPAALGILTGQVPHEPTPPRPLCPHLASCAVDAHKARSAVGSVLGNANRNPQDAAPNSPGILQRLSAARSSIIHALTRRWALNPRCDRAGSKSWPRRSAAGSHVPAGRDRTAGPQGNGGAALGGEGGGADLGAGGRRAGRGQVGIRRGVGLRADGLAGRRPADRVSSARASCVRGGGGGGGVAAVWTVT